MSILRLPLHRLQYKTSKPSRAHASQAAAEIVASGFFDEEWYRARYGVASAEDALAHFLGHALEGHSPGPLFDGGYYLESNADIRETGVNPLVHYLRHGRAEGRSNRADASGGDGRLEFSLAHATSRGSSIAVVVHAFYDDIFTEIVESLKGLPSDFWLYAAVTTEENRTKFEKTVKAGGLRCHVNCRVAPNRGRNFSTLFVQFARDIGDKEFVLHIHTKKSLYSGEERRDWRGMLLGGVLGSPAHVASILAIFGGDPQVGLVYARTHKELPYWAHHWLSNRSTGQHLLHRLGIFDFPLQGYFSYPVGGMFWARVDALRPLLDLGLRYEDFPVEAGQTDGTLAHAIERVVGILARARGYAFAIYDRAERTFFRDCEAFNLEQYIRVSPDLFHRQLDKVDLVSFDIFDTVVTRLAMTADSIMRYTGFRMAQKYPAANDFFARRKAAEDTARSAKNHTGDVDLTEIYAAFTPDGGWTPDLVSEARILEYSTDIASVRSRRDIAALVADAKAAKKRVIAISDTYYDRYEIAAVLDRGGLSGVFDAVYLSSEMQARKDHGDLWDKVMAAEATPPSRWLHVGDNEHSDIQAACDRGLHFFHTMNSVTIMERACIPVPSAKRREDWPADLMFGPSMQHLFGSPFLGKGLFALPNLTTAAEVGYVVFGPILYGFLSWIISHPALSSVERLFFFSREGFILSNIYNDWRKRFPDLRLPEGKYLGVSRRVAISAAQALKFNADQILSGAGFRGTFGALLRHRLGLAPSSSWNVDEWFIDLARDRDAVLAALHEIRPQIVAHAQGERNLLHAYMDQEGLTMDNFSGVVDIGYSATIQARLQEVVNRPLIGFYIGAFDTARQVEAGHGFAFGWLEEDIRPWTSRAPGLVHSLVLESFLTAPHGQVTGFETRGKRLVPTFAASTRNETETKSLSELHAGAASYCAEMASTYGSDLFAAVSPLSKDYFQIYLSMLLDSRLLTSDEVLQSLHVDDDFCGSGVIAAANQIKGYL